jgi:NADH:ubiquinone oxidoreductase subunit 3 (subunit A)
MQYDFYFEKAGGSQQFWYRVTLMLILFSPIAVLLCPWLQLVWRNRPMRQRFQYVGVTAATWFVVFSVLLIAGVPILDFLFD